MTYINISPERQKQLDKLALKRANEILDSWWYEDTGEFQDEENLTDEEIEYLLSVGVKVILT